MINSEDKKILVKIIKKYIPECKIYLFGSRSRKTHFPESDIDIAIDAGKRIDRYLLSNIREDIEESRIPFFVDILDMHDISQDIKDQILKDKILWNS